MTDMLIQLQKLYSEKQSPDQLGFTANLNYLMAAVQRGECQRYAVDNKLTCFGVGRQPFPQLTGRYKYESYIVWVSEGTCSNIVEIHMKIPNVS